jgi:glycosyltransferase involved in cell wall biosynthesis
MKEKDTLILILAYEAESHIEELLARVESSNLPENWEILFIDDASKDNTYLKAIEECKKYKRKATILKNPKNLGYGGNQKIGYEYAIREGFKSVVLLHGDCQYPPEHIFAMIDPITTGKSDVVFGSRMLNKKDALKGGMPLYKWVGNQIITYIQNKLLGTNLSECHTGFRAYRVSTLASIPFKYNSNNFHFDADIIIQCHRAGAKISEIPIPTRYANEICRVNGMAYCINCIKTGVSDVLTQKEIFYKRKFDLQDHPIYKSKLNMEGSSHSLALSLCKDSKNIVDIGGGNGVIAKKLAENGCHVTIVDNFFEVEANESISIIDSDVQNLKEVPKGDTVLLLDLIEHITRKEQFILLEKIRKMSWLDETKVIISVPNSVFLPVRLMFTLGFINYGRRGILDETHAFLFTKHSLKELLDSAGFNYDSFNYTVVPYSFVFGDNFISRTLTKVHEGLNKILPGLFAYQIIVSARPKPSTEALLKAAEHNC